MSSSDYGTSERSGRVELAWCAYVSREKYQEIHRGYDPVPKCIRSGDY